MQMVYRDAVAALMMYGELHGSTVAVPAGVDEKVHEAYRRVERWAAAEEEGELPKDDLNKVKAWYFEACKEHTPVGVDEAESGN